MQSALDLALDYTHTREQFNKKIGTFQLMQGKLAGQLRFVDINGFERADTSDMYTKLSASRAYVYAVARACDAGNVSRQVCAMQYADGLELMEQDCAGAILYSSDRAVEVAMEAQQCLVSRYVDEFISR